MPVVGTLAHLDASITGGTASAVAVFDDIDIPNYDGVRG